MSPYKKCRWVVMIGFKAEHLAEIAPIVNKLKEKYPETGWNIGNSKFPQYDFILFGFADDRDQAHKIGLATVKGELSQHLSLLYWVKEVNLLKYNVKTGEGKG